MKRLFIILLVVSLIIPTIIRFGINDKLVFADDVVIETENMEENVIPTESGTTDETATPETVIFDLGDVDGSKIIDANDALSVLKHAAKITELDQSLSVVADVDKNAIINSQDALYILQYSAKIIVRFVFTPKENIQVLKDYIKENGVSDDKGVYTLSRDYVAENDSDYNIEVDSIAYDTVDDELLYQYNVDYSDDSGSYVYSYIIKFDDRVTDIRVVYDEDSTDMAISVDVTQRINNDQIKISSFYDATLKKDKYAASLKGVSHTSADKKKFENDVKKYVNAMLHMGMLSMEDYLKNTLVMTLKDLGYSSYTYSDEQLYRTLAPLFGIDIDIQDSYAAAKDLIINNGQREGDEIIIYTTVSGGESERYVSGYNGDIYLVYNEKEDVIYFAGVLYTRPHGYAASVIIQPFTDGYSYCNVSLYEPENYDIIYEVEFLEKSNEYKKYANYDYEYIYPENGKMNSMEEDIVCFGISKLLDSVDYQFYSKADDSELLHKLGYINIQ